MSHCPGRASRRTLREINVNGRIIKRSTPKHAIYDRDLSREPHVALLAGKHQRPQFFDIKWWFAPVKHGMAVRADRHKIIDGVNAVLRSYRCNGHSVMNVNEADSKFSILLAEVHLAHLAGAPVVCNACAAGFQ